MKNAIKLILEIMFKIYFGTLVGLALLFLLFYGIGKIYFSPLNTLSSRWDITIPKQTKVEEYYSSDHGFHGDGYRIIMLLLFLCELVNILTEPYVFSRFLGAHPCKERLDAGWNTLIFKLNLTKE